MFMTKQSLNILFKSIVTTNHFQPCFSHKQDIQFCFSQSQPTLLPTKTFPMPRTSFWRNLPNKNHPQLPSCPFANLPQFHPSQTSLAISIHPGYKSRDSSEMRSGNEGLEAVDLALKMLGVMTRLNSNVATAFCAAKIPNFLGVVGVMLGAALS